MVRRLDDVWEEQRRPRIGFVKLDVEGAEPLVLRGGRVFFESLRPVACCEVNPEKLHAMGFCPKDILEAFSNWGYAVLAWSHRERCLIPYRPSTDDDKSTVDLVFVPE